MFVVILQLTSHTGNLSAVTLAMAIMNEVNFTTIIYIIYTMPWFHATSLVHIFYSQIIHTYALSSLPDLYLSFRMAIQVFYHILSHFNNIKVSEVITKNRYLNYHYTSQAMLGEESAVLTK
jgi:hypothetical protein